MPASAKQQTLAAAPASGTQALSSLAPQSQPQDSQPPAKQLQQPSHSSSGTVIQSQAASVALSPASSKRLKPFYVPDGAEEAGPNGMTLVQAILYRVRQPPFRVQSCDTVRLRDGRLLPVAAVGYLWKGKRKMCRVGVVLIGDEGQPTVDWIAAEDVDSVTGRANEQESQQIDQAWAPLAKKVRSCLSLSLSVLQATEQSMPALRPRNAEGRVPSKEKRPAEGDSLVLPHVTKFHASFRSCTRTQTKETRSENWQQVLTRSNTSPSSCGSTRGCERLGEFGLLLPCFTMHSQDPASFAQAVAPVISQHVIAALGPKAADRQQNERAVVAIDQQGGGLVRSSAKRARENDANR